MTLGEMAKALDLEDLTPGIASNKWAEVTSGHASDLLSDVLANAAEGGLLVTIQTHMNVIAVSVHAGLAGVVISAGRRPTADVIAKAEAEGIQIYSSAMRTFDVAGRLYELGVRGSDA